MTEPFPLCKSDLRGQDQDQKRYRSHKAKWALNPATIPATMTAPLRRTERAPHRPLRQKDFSASAHGKEGRSRYHNARQAGTSDTYKDGQAKRAEWRTINGSGSSSSASEGEDSHDHDAQDIKQEFIYGVAGQAADETRDPSSGSQVLNVALDRALALFEDRETETLVKTEWSVVDSQGEEQVVEMGGVHTKKGRRSSGRKAVSSAGAVSTDEDELEYELV